jgi:cobalt-zinc-cadmium resistance protein CzcA
VSLRVVKQPTAETLATARAVRARVPELAAALPEGMTLHLFYDQGELVRRALGGVGRALAAGGLFVALVLVVLLGNLRGAAIVLALLPLAILGAALPLLGLDLGLNAMTLGGLAIAVGLPVDAGVIMVENLAHRLHERGSPAGPERHAAIDGAAAEVAAPIATAVLVILATFVPLVAVGGVAGRRGALVEAAAILLALPAIGLALRLGTNFLPALDEGAVMVQTVLPSDLSLAAVDEANQLLERRLGALPGVAASYRRTGRGELTEDPMPHYPSDVLLLLAPGADAGAVGRELEAIAERLPYALEITTPFGMRIAEGIGGTPADIQVELFHPDLDALAPCASAVRERLERVPGVVSVVADTGSPLPRWRVVPDDDALRRLDVPRALVFDTVAAALQGIALPPRFEGPQRIERLVRFPHDGRLTAEALKRLPMIVEEGRIVDLGQVVSFEESPTPSMIRRKNGQRRLGFNVRTAGDLGGAARGLEAALEEELPRLPRGTSFALSGKLEEARETGRRLAVASGAALALIVVLLYLALGRAREVAVVLATLPVAFAGGLYALWAAGETWNASSIVGLVGLFGVAVQNSLVLITQTKELLARGLPFRAALRAAALGRVRPKLMTAGAAILGLAPMLFGFGGSELERPLAIVMVGGLVSSTLFTLLVLPAVYARCGSPWSERAVARS